VASELASRHLVDKLQYPEALALGTYDPHFAIRGLHFDKRKGLLLKLDAFRNIQTPSTEAERPGGCASQAAASRAMVHEGARAGG
jgi:hypothetical protein